MDKTAREKFKIGQKVKMSPLAIQGYIQGWRGQRSRTGIVVGFSHRHHSLVLVRPDGRKTALSFYMGFWSALRAKNEGGEK